MASDAMREKAAADAGVALKTGSLEKWGGGGILHGSSWKERYFCLEVSDTRFSSVLLRRLSEATGAASMSLARLSIGGTCCRTAFSGTTIEWTASSKDRSK